MAMQLPPIASVSSLSTDERARILDVLFEPSTALHTLSVSLLSERPFDSYPELVASVGMQMMDLFESTSTSDTEWLDKILAAHPRLGQKKGSKALSESSRREQAQLNTGDDEEAAKLAELNTEYEKVFPSLRYVVFVNGRTMPVIIKDMEERIRRADITIERKDAMMAMAEIAVDRASKLV